MGEIEFRERKVTMVSAKMRINDWDYMVLTPEMFFCFDDERLNMGFSLIETEECCSEWNLIQGMYELLECESDAEMAGRKMRVVDYRKKYKNGEWLPWEFAGYGAAISDRFMDAFGDDGKIYPYGKLKKVLEKKYVEE